MNVCQAIPARRYGRRTRVSACSANQLRRTTRKGDLPQARQTGPVRGEYDSGAVPRLRQSADESVVKGKTAGLTSRGRHNKNILGQESCSLHEGHHLAAG